MAAAPSEAKARSAQGWPDRRACFWLTLGSGVAALGLFLLARYMDGGLDVWQEGVRAWTIAGNLRYAVPSIGGRAEAGIASPLVIFGDPRVFTAVVVTMTVVAWRSRDRRLAAYCFLAPMVAEALCQLVAKPSFFAWVGGKYGYPSGHTTAATCTAIAAFVLVRRLKGKRWAYRLAPVFMGVALVTAAGVVISGMHPIKDAYGALMFSVAVMGLLLVAVLRRD